MRPRRLARISKQEEREWIWQIDSEKGHTSHLEGLPRLCLHPFAIDVCDIGLEQRGVVELWHDMRHVGSLTTQV